MRADDVIERVWAREVINSRGYAAVEAEVFLALRVELERRVVRSLDHERPKLHSR